MKLTQILNEILSEDFHRLLENAQTIGPKQAVDLIMGAGSKMFTIEFTKKDGTDRIMNCMRGVKKHLKGGTLPYDPYTKGLVPVYDLQASDPANAYRMINVTAMKALRIGGRSYVIDNTRDD